MINRIDSGNSWATFVAALARDLKDLQKKFTIDSVTPLDMFPQTAEIEVAVHIAASNLSQA